MPRETQPKFARTIRPSPFGDLNDRLDAMRIEGDVKDRLRRLASQEGLPLSEFVREVLRNVAYGPDMTARLAAARSLRVGGLLGQFRRGN